LLLLLLFIINNLAEFLGYSSIIFYGVAVLPQWWIIALSLPILYAMYNRLNTLALEQS